MCRYIYGFSDLIEHVLVGFHYHTSVCEGITKAFRLHERWAETFVIGTSPGKVPGIQLCGMHHY